MKATIEKECNAKCHVKTRVGRVGSFEVTANHQLLHSKLRNAREGQQKCQSKPEIDSILKKLRPMID